MVVGARESFQFFRQKTWFLENNRALSKFLYEVWHYLINYCYQITIKSVHKKQNRPSLSLQLYENGTPCVVLQNTFQKLHSKHDNLCGVCLYI